MEDACGLAAGQPDCGKAIRLTALVGGWKRMEDACGLAAC